METFTRRSKRINKRYTKPIVRLQDEQAQEISFMGNVRKREMLARATLLRRQEKNRSTIKKKEIKRSIRRNTKPKVSNVERRILLLGLDAAGKTTVANINILPGSYLNFIS